MKRLRPLALLTAACTAIAAVGLSLSFVWSKADRIEPVKETDGITAADGTKAAAVSILDLTESGTVMRANYTPDVFVTPTVPSSAKLGRPVELGETKIADSGTLQFIFLNLDPWSEDFYAQSEELASYLGPDNNWHFSFYLPPVLSAANVFVSYKLAGSAGAISDYEMIEYGGFNIRTDKHKNGTEPFIIDLSFPSKRETILTDRLQAARIVTVHYEGVKGRAAGLTSLPLVGEPSVISSLISRDKSVLSAFLIISAFAVAVFVFLCFLKQTISFLPQPLMTLGVFGTMLAAFKLLGPTSAPYGWQSAGLFFFSFILLAALAALRVRWRKKPVWLIPVAFAAVNCALALGAPFIGAGNLYLYLRIANAVTAFLTLFFAALYAFRTSAPLRLINPVLAGVAALVASFYPATSLAFTNPVLWLFVLMIAVTITVSFMEFVSAERRNRYLTANLADEVTRQTKDLQTVISERDRILLYVSHDMKKPVVVLDGFLTDLRQKLSDADLVAKVDFMLQKNGELKKDFTELGKYGKLNYMAEQSEVINVSALVRSVAEDLRPDCEANGIKLTVVAPARLNAYGKKNGLTSVILNLILNAIEHSGCKHLTVAAAKKKGWARIEVTDDGMGIKTDRDIFEPYISGESRKENSGLGLYLARTSVRSMGGELDYEEKPGRLTFTVKIPLS